ncbi:MAG: hypothetical protein KIT22_13090 [Verrucomicrobiae bacterium]|nr:hypothetical protein [Verrucomicrobiae bacterium]
MQAPLGCSDHPFAAGDWRMQMAVHDTGAEGPTKLRCIACGLRKIP